MKMMMTNELPAEIMENGIHYTLVGDYYFPTCMLADRSPNGKWASLYVNVNEYLSQVGTNI